MTIARVAEELEREREKNNLMHMELHVALTRYTNEKLIVKV